MTCAAPCDVDLEHDVAAVRRLGPRGAVEVAEELGVLEEAVGGDPRLEGRRGRRRCRRRRLAGPLGAGGPAPRQPQAGVGGDEPADHGALADPAGSADDDDHGRSPQGCGLS